VLKTELGTSQATVVPALEVPLNFNLLPSSYDELGSAKYLGSTFAQHLLSLADTNDFVRLTQSPDKLRTWMSTGVEADVDASAAQAVFHAATRTTPAPHGDTSWEVAAVLTLAGVVDPVGVVGWAGAGSEWDGNGRGNGESPATAATAGGYDDATHHHSDHHHHRPAGYCLEFFLSSVSPTPGTPGADTLAKRVGHLLRSAGNSSRTGVLGQIPQKSCKLHNDTDVMVPYFNPSPSLRAVDESLFHDLTILNNASLDKLMKPPPCDHLYVGASSLMHGVVMFVSRLSPCFGLGGVSRYECPLYLLPDGFGELSPVRCRHCSSN